MRKFKPCPFCGAKNIDVQEKSFGYAVVCVDCRTSGPIRDRANWATSSWNKRATKKIEVWVPVGWGNAEIRGKS